MIEFLIVIVIIVILFALGFGLMGMLRGEKQGSDKMFKSLVVRVTLSVALFIFVIFAGYMVWIEPNRTMIDAPQVHKK